MDLSLHVGPQWGQLDIQSLRVQSNAERPAADGKAGADYAGNSKCFSRGKKLVGVSSEAWAVAGWKSTDETV